MPGVLELTEGWGRIGLRPQAGQWPCPDAVHGAASSPPVAPFLAGSPGRAGMVSSMAREWSPCGRGARGGLRHLQTVSDCCSCPSWNELMQVPLPQASCVPAVSVMTAWVPSACRQPSQVPLLKATHLFLPAWAVLVAEGGGSHWAGGGCLSYRRSIILRPRTIGLEPFICAPDHRVWIHSSVL